MKGHLLKKERKKQTNKENVAVNPKTLNGNPQSSPLLFVGKYENAFVAYTFSIKEKTKGKFKPLKK